MNEKPESQPTREALLELLHAAVDGIDGYESETGDLRYWKAESIAEARRVVELWGPRSAATDDPWFGFPRRIDAVQRHGDDHDPRNGDAVFTCPICTKPVPQRSITTYSEKADTPRSVDMCTDCADDYERETGRALDSDIPGPDAFEHLWCWAMEAVSGISFIDEDG